MNNGINQSGRMPKSLNPDFVVHDERTLLDLVQFTLSYAESVYYFSLEKKPVGTWRSFLLNDPVFIVGLIASTSLNPYKLRQEEYELKGGANFEKSSKIRAKMAENQLAMIQNLFLWEGFFQDCNYSGPVTKEIKNGINSLESIIHSLLPAQKLYLPSDFPGINRYTTGNREEISLRESFKLSYKNLTYIVEFAFNSFEELVHSKTESHKPHIGLLLASLKLFKEIQQDLNGLTKRHLDFYYQRILQQIPKNPSPIQALVGLIPKPGGKFLPENSSFGMLFPTKKSVPMINSFLTDLGRSKIAELRSVYKSDYFPFSTGSKIGELSLNRVYDSLLFAGEEKQEVSFFGTQPADFPVCFGEDQSHKGLNNRTMENSLLGFAVSSPVFLVEEGNHFFKISIELTKNSSDQFQTFLSQLLHDKEKYLGIAHTPSERELRSFIHGFLNEAFSVSITSITGWKSLNFLHVEFFPEKNTLSFKVEPEGKEELPFPFTAGLHDGMEDTNWPCLRFLLNNSAHYPPYKALSNLEIVSVEIQTLSKGVKKGIECVNQNGKLDPYNPFLPFGSTPGKDSFLRVYHPLALNSFLSRLSISLSWMGLPEQRGGFKDHYRAYPQEITNSAFKARIGIVSDNTGLEKEENGSLEVISLFEGIEKSDGEYLLKNKTLSLNLDLVDKSILSSPNRDDQDKEQAYLFIGMEEPIPFVFGHEQYTRVFAERSLYNSRFPKRQKELPNTPYTPVLEKIEFTYSNYTKENFSRKGDEQQESIRFYHLFPFGFSKIFPGTRSSESNMLPKLSGKGNLLIGLTQVNEDQFVNLGFKLHPAYFIHTITKAPSVKWEFLEKNKWFPLGNLLLEDSTHGMLQSGIVKIKLPTKMDLSNTRLSPGKFWLRVSYSADSDINSRLVSVFTNAAWLTEDKQGQVPELTSEEIREIPTLVNNGNLMIDGVLGPFHLMIPALKKTVDQDRIRISELIRHRNRAITTWDIERLVLERFPQIGRVMAYGRSDFPLHLVKNSNIQVVIIPQTPLLNHGRTEGFRAPFELLQEVKTYLKSFVSPFSRVEVCNPVFEKLKVRAAVKFKNSQQAGYFRDKLERDLIEFLSPNPGDLQKENGFINSIYKAEIQNFIESRPYVDFITGFSVLQIVEVQGKFKIIDTASTAFKVELLRTISPYAILTSADSHHLELLDYQELKDPELASIGDLSIDSDFIIKSS